ncbi:hypothetical protein TNCV_1811981 [Trichonephila clavipes]|uniref:Uncharacterized protein n=1 Tax=Trichonephila clavipes TaxID=2585209 RepID=A0A8X6W799_TRICX|nr:hypothetical protein TNCV_1811981 [Trichonephila clavipes]
MGRTNFPLQLFGQDMDVCKCIGPLRCRGTLNSCRTASPLVGLEEERWVVPDPHHQGVLPLNWGVTELNHTTCMELKATANGHTSSSLP